MAQNGRVRVAVDAMGGDYAPEEIVKGAVLAAQKDDVEIFLVGSTNILEKELARYKFTTTVHPSMLSKPAKLSRKMSRLLT